MNHRAQRLRALWFGVAATAGGVAAFVLGVQSRLGQRTEASVLAAAEFRADAPAPLSLVSVYTLVAALVAVGLIALATWGVRRAVSLVLLAGGTVVLAQLLKERMLFRPGLFELDAANTFPSGHMTVFAVVTVALIWAVPARLRGLVSLAMALIMSVAGWQLLAFAWHRPSDVFGAQALAVAVFAFAAAFRRPRKTGPRRRESFATRGSRLEIVTNFLLTVSGVILALGAAALVAVGIWAENDGIILTAGQLGAVATSALTARLAVALSPQ